MPTNLQVNAEWVKASLLLDKALSVSKVVEEAEAALNISTEGTLPAKMEMIIQEIKNPSGIANEAESGLLKKTDGELAGELSIQLGIQAGLSVKEVVEEAHAILTNTAKKLEALCTESGVSLYHSPDPGPAPAPAPESRGADEEPSADQVPDQVPHPPQPQAEVQFKDRDGDTLRFELTPDYRMNVWKTANGSNKPKRWLRSLFELNVEEVRDAGEKFVKFTYKGNPDGAPNARERSALVKQNKEVLRLAMEIKRMFASSQAEIEFNTLYPKAGPKDSRFTFTLTKDYSVDVYNKEKRVAKSVKEIKVDRSNAKLSFSGKEVTLTDEAPGINAIADGIQKMVEKSHAQQLNVGHRVTHNSDERDIRWIGAEVVIQKGDRGTVTRTEKDASGNQMIQIEWDVGHLSWHTRSYCYERFKVSKQGSTTSTSTFRIDQPVWVRDDGDWDEDEVEEWFSGKVSNLNPLKVKLGGYEKCNVYDHVRAEKPTPKQRKVQKDLKKRPRSTDHGEKQAEKKRR